MSVFEIRDNFYLNGKPVKIISGAIHYFRIVPEYWRDRLEKLKAMGCNTVETYIPWNLHEREKGEFCFEGILDIERFVGLAEELGLHVILLALYLCGVGVRRPARMASSGGRYAAAGQLRAFPAPCGGVL